MSISVIVPIFNAEKYLQDFFTNIEQNDFEAGDEILLTDNGSTDRSAEICRKKAEERPELYKLLSYTEKAGSYSARNYAVQKAGGSILVFTDSDTKPSAEWLTVIRKNIAHGTVIAGKIELEDTRNGLWEQYDIIVHLNSEANAKRASVATANMAVLREDFDRIGPFEERFSGGDYDWSHRAADAGFQIRFVPEALVRHPTRKSFAQILKKEQRIAFGAGNHYLNQNKPRLQLNALYFFRIFNFKTNIRYSRQLRKRGICGKDIVRFNVGFMKIRFEQLKYANKGYCMADARKLDLK